MDDIRTKVSRFLKENKSPENKEIKDFLDELAKENPSLDINGFKKKFSKLIEQGSELESYEIEISSIDTDLPYYEEFKKIIIDARNGHEKFEDISEELMTAKKLLKSLKSKEKEKKGK